ncbi:FHA domain-containing protein [Ornithinimicrobium sp. Arc0846-15]|uniref:FHA domain-containing protein FhaB/FipA n=1 Tax=Ornithinimicrobium sp. INDO-MA30-4 TaxID=2908651 RepID=UPI001C6685F0|nr:FHA domain-containing protein [Ornithinimicrobium sp. INDO-MA30-4]MBW8172986.1 FHA domain-containing protein [Ornithinimicrobium laminariae]UJH70014.1 FHA domain-containing protein [Ornithinimicrobium sp. INDO-MA30-4]
MSELTLNVIRLGLLALLWAFVFSIVGALRADLYGTRVLTRGSNRRPEPRAAAKAPKQSRAQRQNGPTHLAVIAGSLRGTTVPLSEKGILIGRNPECTLVLTDDFASGRHLRVYPGQDAWFADDLESTNGTFVNQQRIDTGARLVLGSQIRIGQTVIELRR